jgi:Uma2 family endonuclease
MNIQQPKRMTVDEYLAWALEHPGRYELIDGAVRQMSPETVRHADIKGQIYIALRQAIKRAGLKFFTMADGMTVRVAPNTAFEPDALVYGEPRVDDDSIEIPNPIIIVEVGSPSTGGYDEKTKLPLYLALPSVRHVLIVNAKARSVTHHRKLSDGSIVVEQLTGGILRLDPPGLEIPVADFFAVD